jgi:hypothetical protein
VDLAVPALSVPAVPAPGDVRGHEGELAQEEVVLRDLETAAQHLDRDQLVVRLVEVGHVLSLRL